MSAPRLRLCSPPCRRRLTRASCARSMGYSIVTSKSVSFGVAFDVVSEPISAIRRTPGHRRAACANLRVASKSDARTSRAGTSSNVCCLLIILSGILELKRRCAGFSIRSCPARDGRSLVNVCQCVEPLRYDDSFESPAKNFAIRAFTLSGRSQAGNPPASGVTHCCALGSWPVSFSASARKSGWSASPL